MEDLFLTLLNRSISAGWLILAVIMLRLLLKKAPRWVPCVLWGLVGFRLVWPFSMESVLSLIPSAETVTPEILYAQIPEIHSGVAAINGFVNPALASSMTPEPWASVNPVQVLVYIAARIWILGMLVLLTYSLVSYLRLRRRVARAVLLRDNLWQCETVTTPFLLGLFRPRIYLPFHLDGQTLDAVAAHEQTHLKRRDHWVKPLAFLILTVYWFQPLVLAAYVLLCRDLELACDERVIRDWDPARKKAYAEALLFCSQPRRNLAACPLAFGEVGVKQRIKNVLHYQKPAFWLLILAVLACVVTAVCFLTDPKEDAPMVEQPPAEVFISSQCLYWNPLTSFVPIDGDSGCRYLVEDDGFTIVNEASGMETGRFETNHWTWQAFPYTEEDWAGLFLPGADRVDLSGYGKRICLPLSEEYQLFNMDGQLWLMELRKDGRGAPFVWSIYVLTSEPGK
ncbi:MAG: M56 family metallopeptidase [Candidatus Avoscillospira sp.]